MVPYELQALHGLRRRGQCPQLPVFVTDCWDWQQKLLELGSLCIRVRNAQDVNHDWSALRGLHCLLLCNDHSSRCQRYEAICWKLLEAGPAQLEAFYPDVQHGRTGPCYTSLVCGQQEPIDKIMRRDTMLWRLLRYG